MQSPFVQLVIALLLLTTVACAQFTVNPGGGFTSIAAVPGVVPMGTLNGCDDCVQTVPLSFTFPWPSGGVNFVNVSSNGCILMDGSTGNLCCSALSLATTTPSRISFAQEDLDPAGLNGCWYVDLGSSIIISFESISMFPGPASGGVNVQVELYANGAIEIRYGTMNLAGNDIVAGISDAAGSISPQPVLAEFDANGFTTGSVAPQNTGVLFIPANATFQVNSADASLDLNGEQAGTWSPAITNACTNQAVTLTTASAVPATTFEMAVALSAAQPATLTTASGQIVNVPLTGMEFLNGGSVPVFAPFFPLGIPVSSGVPVTATAQMIVLNASNPDGFSLSQAGQLDVIPGTGQPPLILGDDNFIEVPLANPLCAPMSTFSFYGVSYTSLFVNSNGSVGFGSGDGDFTSTVAEFQNGSPRAAGLWADLSPNFGGTVTVTTSAIGVTVSFVGVPQFAVGGSNSFDLMFDIAGQTSIANYAPDPAFSSPSIVGLTPGGGATDPTGGIGLSWDALAGTGPQGGAFTDMVYEVTPTGAAPNALWTQIDFPTSDGTSYIVN